MKRIMPMLILTGLMLLVTGCAGDMLKLSEGTPSDISLDTLLKRMDGATDPSHVYASVKSYRMVQLVVSKDKDGDKKQDEYTSEIFWKAPDSLRQVSSKNGEPFRILVAHNGQAWYIDPKTLKSTEITGFGYTLVKAFLDMARPGCNYKEIFPKLSVDKVQDVRSGQVRYRLICDVDKDGIAPYVLYIDPKTWLTDRCETILYTDNGPYLYVAESRDYVWRNKVCMSMRQFVTVADKTDISMIQQYTFNPEIPEDAFDVSRPWYYNTKGSLTEKEKKTDND